MRHIVEDFTFQVRVTRDYPNQLALILSTVQTRNRVRVDVYKFKLNISDVTEKLLNRLRKVRFRISFQSATVFNQSLTFYILVLLNNIDFPVLSCATQRTLME